MNNPVYESGPKYYYTFNLLLQQYIILNCTLKKRHLAIFSFFILGIFCALRITVLLYRLMCRIFLKIFLIFIHIRILSMVFSIVSKKGGKIMKK